MLYQNTNQIFWNNQSLEKPDNVLINGSFNTWNELGATVAFNIDINTLTFNISSTNANFNINLKWFKFVDNNNNTYYYILDSWSLHGTTYTITLSLDIWSTYLAPYFDSSQLNTNQALNQYVYFKQKEKTNNNLFLRPLQDNSYLFNVYQEHTNLNTSTFNFLNNNQKQSDWGMLNSYNFNNGNMNYYTFVYKVNLMSSAEKLYTGMVDNLTYISFSPVAANSNSKSWGSGYWNWYKLIQSTTKYDLDLVELPFDLSNNEVNNTNDAVEWQWTQNEAINNENNLLCYYLNYGGEKANINFSWLNNVQSWLSGLTPPNQLSEQDAFTMFNNDQIPLYINSATNNLPFSFLEFLFPYLFNFRRLSFSYMLQEYNLTIANFKRLYDFFNPTSWVFMFVPNYPTLMLNIYIDSANSYTGISTLIGSFNFMNTSITNTLSVSNNFLSQNKNVIQTAHSMVQNDSNLMISNEILSTGNLMKDISDPLGVERGIIDTKLNNQNLWRQYSLDYGSAKLSTLSKSNSMTSAGTNTGLVANMLLLNDTHLRTFDLIKVITHIDKFGYIYENWDFLNTWYVKKYHNFVKITMGLEKIFNQTIPDYLVNTCIEMLSNGVIIWTNLFSQGVRYFDIRSVFNNWQNPSDFETFSSTYFYNMEATNDNTN